MFSGITDALFGKNPANGASKYYDQIEGKIKPYYQPYIDSGNQNMQWHDNATQQMLNDPTAIYNKIGSGYTQSPGYGYNLQQQMQAAKNVGAASGQAGSPALQQYMMEQASGLAAQDYDNYMNANLGIYGMGYGGAGQATTLGYQASNDLATNLADTLMNQGNIAYAGQANKNAQNMGLLSMIAGLGGAGMGMFGSSGGGMGTYNVQSAPGTGIGQPGWAGSNYPSIRNYFAF